MGANCFKDEPKDKSESKPEIEKLEEKKEQDAAVNWDDNHSPLYTIQWKGNTINTAYHQYTPSMARKPASGFTQYKTAPGPNFWLPSNVQVANDELHLVVYNNLVWAPTWENKPVWCMSGAVLTSTPLNSYGTISVDIKCYGNTLDTSLDKATTFGSFTNNKNVVLGIFTYDNKNPEPPSNPNREIDLLETVSKYNVFPGQPQTGNAQFTMQKADQGNASTNVKRLDFTYADLNKINVQINWSEEQVIYTANDGKGNQLATWTYTDMSYIPTPSETTFLHFNLWCINFAPADDLKRHISISNVQITSN